VTGPSLVAGPHNPATTTPPRRPGSERRTTSIDTVRPDRLHGVLVVEARGRDLGTESGERGTGEGDTSDSGHPTDARVLEEIGLTLRLDARSHALVDIEFHPREPDGPDEPDVRPLLGATVGPGFRRQVDQVMPAEHDRGSLLHLLLDDLVGAVLVSGYALLHADVLPPQRGVVDAMVGRMGDRCAGWALDGGFITTLRDVGRIPTPHGPAAPLLEPADDPWAWHPMATLPPGATRRRRRLDVLPPDADGLHPIDAYFRDSYRDADGNETVVHEYGVTGSVDPIDHRIVELRADALVLPWTECPAAIASAERLRGTSFDDLRMRVRRDLVGTSSCTHLNDTLRSLADLGALLHA
jgi:hypothetical protein